MIKKALIGTAVLATLGTFVFGRDVLSYAKTWGSSVREAVKSEVPLDFEVKRAREMVENLVPDIRRCMQVIAEQQVDIEDLTKEVSRREVDLETQKEAMLKLKGDLQTGNSTFVYAKRTYSSEDVKRDLSQRFERFKVADDTLQRERKIVKAREDALVANQSKLEGMLVSKKDLEVQIEQLEARLKAVQAAETVSTLEIDNSQLSSAKKLIRELNKQLDVKEKLLDADGKFTGLIPVETKEEVPVDIANQVDEYFSGDSEINVVDLDTLKP